MSFDWSFKDYFNLSRKIPLHYQKRYLANISNGSFNASFLTGVYKNKIKQLSENNRLLALALQNDRTQKEELLAESKANADLVLFSRLKLATMSESLKKAANVLDEALSLLEMHSSNSISKFTPKNTIVREEFKEQLKEVTMAAIPEEIEFPEDKQTPTKRNLTNDVLQNTKDAAYQTSFSERMSNQQNLNKKEQNIFGNKSIKENSRQIKIRDVMVSPVKKSAEFCDNKITKDSNSILFKTKRKKNICYRKRTQKTTPQATTRSNKGNLNDNLNETSATLQFNDLKNTIVASKKYSGDFNCFDNSTEKCDPLSLNSDQTLKCEDIPQKQENQKNSEGENSSKPSTSNNKKTHELHKVINYSSIEKSSSDESLKNNSNEKQLFNTIKNNPLNKDLKKPNVKKTALKNISSKMNIENLKFEKIKRKSVHPIDALTLIEMDEKEVKKRKSVCPLDDLTSTVTDENNIKKKKSDKLILKNIKKSTRRKKIENENISPVSDTSKMSTDLNLQSDTAIHEREMVKNLAKNTFLVSAEVHKIPTVVSGIFPKTDNLEPVVLVNDVFKATKSLCKSISSQPFNQANEISLEKQLLQHCSSLKIIAEDSLNTQNKSSVNTDSGVGESVDQDKDSPKTILNVEPPLLVDGEVNEKQMNEDKKTLRKRQPMICYREPPVNTKLRRGKF